MTDELTHAANDQGIGPTPAEDAAVLAAAHAYALALADCRAKEAACEESQKAHDALNTEADAARKALAEAEKALCDAASAHPAHAEAATEHVEKVKAKRGKGKKES